MFWLPASEGTLVLWTPCLRAFRYGGSLTFSLWVMMVVVMFEFGVTRAIIQVRMFLQAGETLYKTFLHSSIKRLTYL